MKLDLVLLLTGVLSYLLSASLISATNPPIIHKPRVLPLTSQNQLHWVQFLPSPFQVSLPRAWDATSTCLARAAGTGHTTGQQALQIQNLFLVPLFEGCVGRTEEGKEGRKEGMAGMRSQVLQKEKIPNIHKINERALPRPPTSMCTRGQTSLFLTDRHSPNNSLMVTNPLIVRPLCSREKS